MATRKTAPSKATGKKAASKKAAAKRAPSGKSASKKTARKRARPQSEIDELIVVATELTEAADIEDGDEKLSPKQREARFNVMVQTACLKAGTAAAIATISRRVPFLGRLAPVILGSMGETIALTKIQQQLVKDVIALYGVELSELEEKGVILLATAANVGAKQLSKATADQLVKQLGGVLYRPVLARVLPLAAVGTEIAAAVASTYAVGKRAQALCKLPGTGARDLSDLLRGLSGLDKTRLFKWSGEALSLALKPFKGALTALVPGLR